MEDADKLRKKLSRAMTAAVAEYGLLQEGDKVLVAISGGKDSYTMLDLLWSNRSRAPYRFDLVAVHLDQVQPGYDGRPLQQWLANFGAPYEILQEDTFSLVSELTREGGTPCAPCSRFRRGILYSAAERLGCNKIALGHHRDDALETFLMNLFYKGSLESMPPVYTTDDGRFQVIRPLIEIAEADIVAHARHAAYPILPCNLCGSIGGLRRDAMGALLTSLEQQHPHIRNVMLRALKNVRPTHLMDPQLLAAWQARPDSSGLAPESDSCKPSHRFAAMPIATGDAAPAPSI